MCKPALDIWDMRPQSMTVYLSNYGWHFNKSLCEYAVSLMYYKEEGQEKSVECLSKDKVKELLAKHGVEVKNLTYDFCPYKRCTAPHQWHLSPAYAPTRAAVSQRQWRCVPAPPVCR